MSDIQFKKCKYAYHLLVIEFIYTINTLHYISLTYDVKNCEQIEMIIDLLRNDRILIKYFVDFLILKNSI